MNQIRLDEIRKRAESATPGPWTWNDGEDLVQAEYKYKYGGTILWPIFDGRGFVQAKNDDARFIECSRQDIPDLLDEIERLREELAKG